MLLLPLVAQICCITLRDYLEFNKSVQPVQEATFTKQVEMCWEKNKEQDKTESFVLLRAEF